MTAASIRPSPAAQAPEMRLVHDRHALFESVVLAHLDAAYTLASWLLRTDPEDVVQDACLKAWRRLDTYRGGDAKSWLLAIVRTTCADHLRAPAIARAQSEPAGPPTDATPLVELLRHSDRDLIARTLADLPEPHREAIVLREIEGLSYTQIATVLNIPAGTVMSRLSRARDALAAALRTQLE